MKDTERIENIVQMMGDTQIQSALRETDVHELATVLHFSTDERMKQRIFSNMSARASQMFKTEMREMTSGDIKAHREASAHVTSIFRTFAHKPDESQRVAIDHYDTFTIGGLIELLTSLARKARLNGHLALQEDIGKIDHPVLKEGLQSVVDIYDAVLLEDYLTELAKRHLLEEKLRCKIIRETLLQIFASQDEERVRRYISAMAPFYSRSDDSE